MSNEWLYGVREGFCVGRGGGEGEVPRKAYGVFWVIEEDWLEDGSNRSKYSSCVDS